MTDHISFVDPLGVMEANCYYRAHAVIFASPQLKSTSWSRDSIDVFWISTTSFNDKNIDIWVFGKTASDYTARSATCIVAVLAMCTRCRASLDTDLQRR